jgi:hypothetical protein
MFTRSFQDFLMQIFFPRLSRKVEQAEKKYYTLLEIRADILAKSQKMEFSKHMSPFCPSSLSPGASSSIRTLNLRLTRGVQPLSYQSTT